MRRGLHLSLALCGVLIGLLATTPAWAHTATLHFVRTWSVQQRGSVTIYNDASLTSTSLSRVLSGAKTWDNLGQTLDFRRTTQADLSKNVCDPTLRNRNLVYRSALDGVGGTLAATYVCRTNTQLLRFTMSFDTAEKWYGGTSTTVPAGYADLASVATHEFGHAAGFESHFDDLSVTDAGLLCSNTSGQQTMCSHHYIGTARLRTLGAHDVHTFSAAY